MKNKKCKCLEHICGCLLKKSKKTKKPIKINDYYNIITKKSVPYQIPQTFIQTNRDNNDLLNIFDKLLGKFNNKPETREIGTQTKNTNDMSTQTKNTNEMSTQSEEIIDDMWTFDYLNDISPVVINRSEFEETKQNHFFDSFKDDSIFEQGVYKMPIYMKASNKPPINIPKEEENKILFEDYVQPPIVINKPVNKPPINIPKEPEKKIVIGQFNEEPIIIEDKPKIFTTPKVYKQKIEKPSNNFEEDEPIIITKNPNQANYYKKNADIISEKKSSKYALLTPEEKALKRKKWNEQQQKRRDALLTPEEKELKEAKRESKKISEEQVQMNIEDTLSKKIIHPKKEIELMSKEDKPKKFIELKSEPLFENIITEIPIKKTTKKTTKISLNRKNLKDTLIEIEMKKYDDQHPKKRGKPSFKSINDRDSYKTAVTLGLENATTDELKQMILNNK